MSVPYVKKRTFLCDQGKRWSKYRCKCGAEAEYLCICGGVGSNVPEEVTLASQERRNLAALFSPDSEERVHAELYKSLSFMGGE